MIIDYSAEACNKHGIAFLPVVFESLGGFHAVVSREVKKQSSALARHTGEDKAGAVRKCVLRMGVLMMKGNAAILRIVFHPH